MNHRFNPNASLKILRLKLGNWVVTLMLFLGPLALPAQAAPSPVFPDARHEELMKSLDFTPPEVTETEEEEISEGSSPNWSWENWEIDLSSTTTWIIFGVLLLVLGFFVYRILDDVSIRKRTKGEDEGLDEIKVEDIEEEELVVAGVSLSLLERAERASQFDIAVRLLYIQLLKELQDGGLIKYRKDFSNRDYQNQLTGHELLADFRAVTYEYERYWFGKYPIDRLSYRNTYQRFQALNARIQALTIKASNHV